MKQYRLPILAASLFAILTFGFVSPSRAETCAIRAVFTKGGFIVGVGGGHGVMICHGRRYRFAVSGMSVGFTIGASGALAAGAGGAQLQNEKGVILQISGGKVGVEVSAAVGGVTITLEGT